ncbi:helix-turn-helix domain-containing protein [Bdellovibrio bacteriovorus]|uniref:helix-turn-helix domain-containing protein n=1 Tax=Bdellovibrio bacteriovorus TaxID=959 RepID=UPI0021D1305C|nr:helix-turn-helix transcriptional regulator [Bdellovibrio bacteriovorus]UXR64525.1 helix-turn-helix domain-containing protein [Bdellovibrio bacteriovorus]
MKKTSKSTGKYLKDKRTALGLSQKDVSQSLGYTTPQFVSNWERGHSYPPVRIIRKLAEIYRISADELFEHVLSDIIFDLRQEWKNKFHSRS